MNATYRTPVLLSAILVLAFVARVSVRLSYGEEDFWQNGYSSYYAMAENVAAGKGFCIDRDGQKCALWPPVYPFLLSLTTPRAVAFPRILILQAAVGAGTVWCAFLIGSEFFGSTTGLIAALLTALNLYYVRHDDLTRRAFRENQTMKTPADLPVEPAAHPNRRILRGASALLARKALPVLLVAWAVVEVGLSWGNLSATYDEPAHIACGMEWLDKGTYTYELLHPPLARVVMALGPYLMGRRVSGLAHMENEGNAILYSAGDYKSNLAAARSGNLLFLTLACLVTFLWARRWFGSRSAVWALFLFVSLPPILGHTSIATLDMACAATVTLALYAFVRCLEEPDWQRFILLGGALGLAFLCKFSSIAFLGLSFFAGAIYMWSRQWLPSPRTVEWRWLLLRVLSVSVITVMIVWTGYRFPIQPLSIHRGVHSTIDRRFAGLPLLRNIAYRALEAPLPLTQFARGIYELETHNAAGHNNDAYLFGRYSGSGWWYFFPVVVGVKTPIGFLILAGCGLSLIMWRFKSGSWQQHLTVVFVAAILLVCMSSRFNLGVRHILAIYPLLAVMGGFAVPEFLVFARRASLVFMVVLILLIAWLAVDSWQARGDYLAYFNEFAGSHPERILAESDLDWGQDLYRLSRRLEELGADHVAIRYFGTAPLEYAGLPPYSELSADVPTPHGYVAVSVRYLTLEHAKNGSFAWLEGKRPLERVGKSIYLYKFD